MFSKQLAFLLLALGCLTAAAGGAYVATRLNQSDASGASAHPVAAPAATASPAGQPAAAAVQPVAETEAPVTAEKPAAPAPARVDAPQPKARPAETNRRAAAKRTAAPVSHQVPTASPQAARTVPMAPAGVPIAQAETAAAPPVPVTTPAADPVKPADDPKPEPARAPAPQFDELILPAASVIGLQVETTMSSERARLEDRVDARVSRDVMALGRVAIPAGSRVIGSVTAVERGGKIRDQARLGIRFHTLVLADGAQVPLHTDPIFRLGDAPSASSTKKIGGAAIGGAIIGAILGGGKGAAIGGATGAAGGTAAVMAGDRSPATLRQGEYLNVKLSSPATITVERD